ncbi:MAG TPA: hypothetical protein VFU02_08410 [Polyangiaceae bacterium]|nr:hypothetical protein [Polyangiaceae bacterium]
MFKLIKFSPVAALVLSMLVTTPALAKIPYLSRVERAKETSSYSVRAPTVTTPLGRYGHPVKITKTEPGKKCTHTHRGSWWHVM